MATKEMRKTPIPRKKQKNSGGEIVYTQPKPFRKNRFFLQLATVVAVVLALVFGLSIFFKVEQVTVSGAEKYSEWDVKEASGIREGDTLLTLSRATIGGKIITKLPYIDRVRIGIKLPNTVNIAIEELDVVYAIADDAGGWWLMNAAGRIVDTTTAGQSVAYTQILGVVLTSPQIGMQAVAAEPVPETSGEETVPTTVSASQQLNAALSVLQSLEESGIIGDAASVDVTKIADIEMWYGNRYQVHLGDSTKLTYKIRYMKAAIEEMGQYQSGELDVSFTIWPDQVGYTPFP